MDLYGLDPQEIDAIAKANMNTSNLAINALQALGGHNLQNAQAENIRNPKLVELDFGGRTFTVRQEDVPQAIQAGARWLEMPSNIEKNVATSENQRASATSHYASAGANRALEAYRGQQLSNATPSYMIDVNGAQIPVTQDQLVNAMRLPSQVAADEANRLKATTDARKTGLDADRLLQQQIDRRSVEGIPIAELLAGDKAVTAINALPGLVNKVQTPRTDGLKPDDRRQIEDSMTKYAISFNEGTYNPAMVGTYNSRAAQLKQPTMYIDTGKKAIPFVLPVVKGKQLTADQVAEDAASLGISINDWLLQAQAKLNKGK